MRYLIPALTPFVLIACSNEPSPEELRQQALEEIQAEAELEPEYMDVQAAFADYLGVWQYEDGSIRQIFNSLGEDDVEACMQVNDGPDLWVQVSEGTYSASQDHRSFTGTFTGDGMGFDELTVTGYPVPEGGLDFINRARIDHTEAVTYETWSAPDDGRFQYIIEQEAPGGGRSVLFSGEWERVTLSNARCNSPAN